MNRPKSPEDALASAHRANMQRYKVVPHRLIWLAAGLSAGTTALATFEMWKPGWLSYSLGGFVLLALIPVTLGWLSTVILGIWADVRFVDTLHAVAISLLCWLVVACTVIGPVLSIFIAPFALLLGVLGARLGMYSNELRWDRKVLGGSLPAPFEEGPR